MDAPEPFNEHANRVWMWVCVGVGTVLVVLIPGVMFLFFPPH